MRLTQEQRLKIKSELEIDKKAREDVTYPGSARWSDLKGFTADCVRDLLADLEEVEQERDEAMEALKNKCYCCAHSKKFVTGRDARLETLCPIKEAGGECNWEFEFDFWDRIARANKALAQGKTLAEPTDATSPVVERETESALGKDPEADSPFAGCLFYPGAITCIVAPCAHYTSGECDGKRLQPARMPNNETHGGEL
jgi:hypothetical protein